VVGSFWLIVNLVDFPNRYSRRTEGLWCMRRHGPVIAQCTDSVVSLWTYPLVNLSRGKITWKQSLHRELVRPLPKFWHLTSSVAFCHFDYKSFQPCSLATYCSQISHTLQSRNLTKYYISRADISSVNNVHCEVLCVFCRSPRMYCCREHRRNAGSVRCLLIWSLLLKLSTVACH